jgi:FeS assembly protein IscX
MRGPLEVQMPPKLTWQDAEDVALLLVEKHPAVDPLTVRFTELRDWVLQLPEFGDTAAACSEGKLEAIQMAWLEEYRAAGQ